MTLQDRCETCPAEALMRFTHQTHKSMLDFCAHHGGPLEPKLTEAGFTLTEDKRQKLYITSSDEEKFVPPMPVKDNPDGLAGV